MTTLISQLSSSGGRRHCNEQCYNAKSKSCECICGGRNHGVSLETAVENTKSMVEDLLKNPEITLGAEILEALTAPIPTPEKD